MATKLDFPVGSMVRVWGYGIGARKIDVRRTGHVIGHTAKRVKVDLDPGNGEPAEIRNLDPDEITRIAT